MKISLPLSSRFSKDRVLETAYNPERAVCTVEDRQKGYELQHPVPFTNVVENLHRIAQYFGKSFDIIGCPGTVHFAILTKVGFHQVVGTIDTHESVRARIQSEKYGSAYLLLQL